MADGERLHPDPERDILLDARTLRGIAHPLRVRLLSLLRHDGPSTATKLGERAGVSSAAASYHLRSLASYGFVVDDEGPPDRHSRERWWRAAHRETWLRKLPDDPDTSAAVEQYLRAVARAYAARTEAWLDGLATAPREWSDVGTLSDTNVAVTPAEARRLGERLLALFAEYRRYEPGEPVPPGAGRLAVQWQLLPEPASDARDDGRNPDRGGGA